MLRQYGIVGARGAKGPWVQGNNVDFVFFTPDLKALTHKDLAAVVPEATEEGQNSIRWVYTVMGGSSRQKAAPVAVEAMKKILEMYPPKDKETRKVPWQLNAETAFFFASYEDRRIVIVPTHKGKITPKLSAAIESLKLLDRFAHDYVFLRVERDQAAEALRKPLQEAGEEGVVILERPQGWTPRSRPWESVETIAVSPGPHTAESLQKLLAEHVRLPGWDARAGKKPE